MFIIEGDIKRKFRIMPEKKRNTFCIRGVKVHVEWKPIKNLYIKVLPPDGAVRVSAPVNAGSCLVKEFVLKRLDWIRQCQEDINSKIGPVNDFLSTGQTQSFLGREYRLLKKESTGSYCEIVGNDLVIHTPVLNRHEVVFPILVRWYSEQLEKILNDLLPVWEKKMGCKVTRINIKMMKTKWGSCNSRTKRISMNLDLIRLRPEVIEYVLVHEMAHIFEPNHGKGFKLLMDKTMPEWRCLDRELSNCSPLLYYLK